MGRGSSRPPAVGSQDAIPSASRVPSGRFSRFVQLGTTVGQMAAHGATEAARRALSRAEEELPHALLTAKNAKLLATRLSRLRGAAMKVGQMLSLEDDGILPKEFTQALEILRASAHRMPEAQVREVLSREYGKNWSERFRQFDLVPMASASIGQVHRAMTHEGREIVLKIQYPGVAESIDSDVDNLRSLFALTRIAPSAAVLDEMTRELKAELRREVDYARELEQLSVYSRCLGYDQRFRLPRPIPEHSTARILAMECVQGVPLLEWAESAPQDERNEVARVLLELVLREFFEFGLSQTDPNPANYLYDAKARRVVLLDFGAARPVPPDVALAYGEALRGLAHRDEARLRQVLRDLNVHNDDVPEISNILVELGFEAAEIFDGTYDFGETDLSIRMMKKGRQMEKFQGQAQPPPPEYVFFQRKLSGTYLLCRQLGAEVDVRGLLAEAELL